MSDLQDVLLPEKKQPFAVTDYGSANWTAATAMEATGKIAVLAAQAREWHDKIDAWYEAAAKEYKETMERMKLFLAPFVEAELKDSNKKSMVLPSARVGFRKAQASLEVTDQEKAIAWLTGKVGAFIRIKREVDKVNVKKFIEETGEVPDGCALKPGAETFYIEPLEKKEKV